MEEEAQNPEAGEGSVVVADELAVSANQSQAEALLKQALANGQDLDSESFGTLKAAIRVAERRVAGQIHLLVDNDTQEGDSLETQLKGLMPVSVRGDEETKSFVAIVLDAKTLCESGSQAKYRLPPTRAPQVQRLLNAVLSTRDDGDLSEGDVLIALDGGKDNDWASKSVTKHLPSKQYSCVKHLVVYTHESAEKRLERASKTPLHLHEGVHFFTQGDVEFKIQPRLVTSGSTRGNVIGPLSKPSWLDGAESWLLPVSVKRNLFGKENLPYPGGQCPIAHDQDAPAKKDELVPAFYHEAPMVLAEELAHYVQARCIVDLSPGSGHWALHSVRRRIPYVGICMTDVHKNLLQKKLISRCLTCMADPQEESLYDATFAKHLKALSEPAAGDEEKDKEKPPKRGGSKNTESKPKQPKVKKTEEASDAASASRNDLLKMIQEAAENDGGEDVEGEGK